MTQDEILAMARKAGLDVDDVWFSDAMYKAVLLRFAKLVAAKAIQPKQEPVAWMYQEYRDDDQFGWRDEIQFVQPPNDPNYFREIIPVYTTPPQRPWVELTDEEIADCAEKMEATDPTDIFWLEFFRDIEAKLKQKNGYAEDKNT